MASQIELLTQMALILDSLVENAKKMKEASLLKFSPKELEQLQERQHEILHELGELEKIVEKSPPGTVKEVNQLKARIREKLGQFQHINQDFFDHINFNTRVIDSGDAEEKKKKG